MLATKRQIAYLQLLADRAQFIKTNHPSLIPQGLTHKQWDIDMTSEQASARIDYHKAILAQADAILFPWKKLAQNEDMPA